MAANWSTTVVHATVQDIGPAITAAVSVRHNECDILSLIFKFLAISNDADFRIGTFVSHRYFP